MTLVGSDLIDASVTIDDLGGCEITSIEVGVYASSSDLSRTVGATLFSNGTEFFFMDGSRLSNKGVGVKFFFGNPLTGLTLGTTCPGNVVFRDNVGNDFAAASAPYVGVYDADVVFADEYAKWMLLNPSVWSLSFSYDQPSLGAESFTIHCFTMTIGLKNP